MQECSWPCSSSGNSRDRKDVVFASNDKQGPLTLLSSPHYSSMGPNQRIAYVHLSVDGESMPNFSKLHLRSSTLHCLSLRCAKTIQTLAPKVSNLSLLPELVSQQSSLIWHSLLSDTCGTRGDWRRIWAQPRKFCLDYQLCLPLQALVA